MVLSLKYRVLLMVCALGWVGCSTDPTETTVQSALRGTLTTAGYFGRPQGGVSSWFLRDDRTGGNFLTFAYGASTGDTPVAGDWDGDGKTTVGVYRDQGTNSNSRWMLRNDNSPGDPQLNFEWGAQNDLPVVGDWDGNGTDTVGIYRKYERKFYLTNSNQPGFDIAIPFDDVCGPSDTCKPVAGDWDGDGKTTVGLYLPATATWTLWNSLASKVTFAYGGSGDVPVVGDWDGDGITTVGVVQAWGDGKLHWLLRNTPNTGGPDEVQFAYGAAGDTPVAGAWQIPNVQPVGNAVPWTTSSFVGSIGTYLADVTGPDGDGKSRADVVTLGNQGIRLRSSTGGPPLNAEAGPWLPGFKGDLATHFADVTGDGRADAIAISSTAVKVAVWTGSSFSEESAPWLSSSPGAPAKGFFMADVTGDGKADLIAVNTGNIKVWPVVPNGNSFKFKSTSDTWSASAFAGTVATLFADVTGDKKADAIKVDGSSITVRRAPATGTAPFSDPEAWSTTGFSGSRRTVLADVTGDGLADLVAINANSITMRRSGRSFFGANVETLSNIPTATSGNYFMADVTGDGRADYLEIGSTSPVQVRVRQDRRIPIRFVQFVTECADVESDDAIKTTLVDTNIRYRDVGIVFEAQKVFSNPDCPLANALLSHIVKSPKLSTLPTDVPATEVELSAATKPYNPGCDLGYDDMKQYDAGIQIWWAGNRCALPGEVLVFRADRAGGSNNGNPPGDGRLIIMRQKTFTSNSSLHHELGHYLGLNHSMGLGYDVLSYIDPQTGQGTPMSTWWDLVFAPPTASTPMPRFFTSKAGAALYEKDLRQINEPNPEAGAQMGWQCPNALDALNHPCLANLPAGSIGIRLGGSSADRIYTYKDVAGRWEFDDRMKGVAPYNPFGPLGSDGRRVAGINVMSYGYRDTEVLGQRGWLSLSQIEIIQSHLATDVMMELLDASGRVIFGGRPRLGLPGPASTVTFLSTTGTGFTGKGGLASNGRNTWKVGTTLYSGGGGNQVSEWNARFRRWDAYPVGALRVALPSDGTNTLWAITAGTPKTPVMKLSGNSFQAVGTDSCARDLAVGARPYVIGCTPHPDGVGNYMIESYNGSTWTPDAGAGTDIAVDGKGAPWVLAKQSGGQLAIYRATVDSSGSIMGWSLIPAPSGAVPSHLTGGALQGHAQPINLIDSAGKVYSYAEEGWNLAASVPFSVADATGALPYLWVVESNGTARYAR